jgi:hypothetical protein
MMYCEILPDLVVQKNFGMQYFEKSVMDTILPSVVPLVASICAFSSVRYPKLKRLLAGEGNIIKNDAHLFKTEEEACQHPY